MTYASYNSMKTLELKRLDKGYMPTLFRGTLEELNSYMSDIVKLNRYKVMSIDKVQVSDGSAVKRYWIKTPFNQTKLYFINL